MKLPKFLSLNHLRNWLRWSPQGKQLVEELSEKTPPRMLIVCHHDQIEIFCEGRVIVKEAIMPYFGRSGPDEIEAEQYMEARLIPVWREVYEPRNRKISVSQVKRTRQDVAWWQAYADVMHAVSEVSSNAKQ